MVLEIELLMINMNLEDFWKSIEENEFHPLNLCFKSRETNSYCKSEIESINSNLTCLLNSITSGSDELIKRLEDKNQFAGAREELEIATHFKRNGFKNVILKKSRTSPCSDIELPTKPPIYIEIYLQQYPGKEKKLDKLLATGESDKKELSDKEIEVLIYRALNDKFNQLIKSQDKPVILILDFGYSESYERVSQKMLEEINLPDFMYCIVVRTKTNLIKINDSFLNEENVKKTLLSLPIPSYRAGSLYGR